MLAAPIMDLAVMFTLFGVYSFGIFLPSNHAKLPLIGCTSWDDDISPRGWQIC